jgi:amino acid transporter
VTVLLSTYPYKLNGAFRLVHELAGISLFTFETGFSAWLCLGPARSWQHLLMLLVFVVGALISFITLLGLTHLLFVGQAITAVAFAVLLISCAQSLVAAPKTLLET